MRWVQRCVALISFVVVTDVARSEFYSDNPFDGVPTVQLSVSRNERCVAIKRMDDRPLEVVGYGLMQLSGPQRREVQCIIRAYYADGRLGKGDSIPNGFRAVIEKSPVGNITRYFGPHSKSPYAFVSADQVFDTPRDFCPFSVYEGFRQMTSMPLGVPINDCSDKTPRVGQIYGALLYMHTQQDARKPHFVSANDLSIGMTVFTIDNNGKIMQLQ